MAHERTPDFRPQRPYEVFGFTKLEQLYWRVSNKRFEGIIQDAGTQVHTIKASSNTFGEFLFVTTNQYTDLLRQRIPTEDAQAMIQDHYRSILPHIRPDTQTKRGQLFEMLADLTDDDGALAEMEDWGDLFDL